MSRINPSPAQRKYDEGRLAQVLVAPIISEKATRIGEKQNQVMFKVEVESVQTVNQKGKTKRFGRSIGRRDHVKKAYVSLKPGQELNFSGEAA